jgi:hypothetical protein
VEFGDGPSREETAQALSFSPFLFSDFFSNSVQIQFKFKHVLNFNFSSVTIIPNIKSIVYNIIFSYSFPCHLFTKGINGSINCFLSHLEK